jgi:hypothetical protein
MTNKAAAVLKAQHGSTDPYDHNVDLVDSLGVTGDASAIAKGKVELATDAETITGTDDTRAVTPAGLAALTATGTRKGLVELAIDAEAKTGTDTARAITAANLRAVLTGIVTISFDGRNNVGACTAVGAVAGMKVLGVFGITNGALGNAAASFEATVTVNDQIQQSAVGNLSANDYVAILLAVA